MSYKIPKNRKTIRTIRMSNGSVLTGEVDASAIGAYNDVYWFKNGKYITPDQMKNYKFYDTKIKGFRTLNDYSQRDSNTREITVETPLYTPAIDKLKEMSMGMDRTSYERATEQGIPFNNQKTVTLKTKGKMNLADVPESLLDSIAVNSGRSDTDFWTNMSLVGKESTFGGISKALGNTMVHPGFISNDGRVSPYAITNNHAYFINAVNDYTAKLWDRYDSTDEAQMSAAENKARYDLEHGNVAERTPHYSQYVFADAFKRYQTAPDKYNPNQKNYVPMLNSIKRELQGEKHLQEYWNTRGKQEYARGQKEGMAYGGFMYKPKDTWDNLSMLEKSEMMKVAVRNGITDLKTIREKYNEFAKGGNIYSGDEKETQQMEVSKSPHVDLAISNPWLYQKLHPAQRKAEKYEPTTFAGRITQLAGASELGQKYADYTSSVIQQVPVVGLVPSALDLGYDTNRLYHKPSLTATKDVTLDAASLVPALRKTMKGWWMKGNSGSFITEAGQIINNPRVASTLEVTLQPFRTAINTGVYGARAADFLDDSKAYLKEMYNSSKIGKRFPIKALGGPLVEAAMNEYKKGGGIHIAPSKKGTFTAAAKKHGKSVQAFASQVLAHPENYSPAMRKKANFARNASHWKHGLGGNLFEEAGQMQIGRPFWQSQTQQPSFMESLAEFNRQQEIKKQQQRQVLREKINTVGRKLAEERMREASVESNDNAWVETPLTYKKKNTHLSRRAEEGAKQHADWEKEHPNLTAWGNLAGVVPFAVASVPLGAGIVTGGDALAATTAGQAVTSGLAPLYQAVTGASIAGAPALTWANTGLQSLMASHGLSEAANGTFTPTTALELTPLAPGIVRTPGIINNLRPQNIRNHWYVAKPPIGYDGIGDAVERWVRGVASGKLANIDNPWWFNNSSAKQLQNYAYVPETVQGIEREQYLQQFGEHALEARADAWRMHNLIPQKYNTFTPNPRHPGSFTDVEGIKRLRYIPPQTEGTPQVDFVNSVGGNVGVPEITNLGNGIPDAGTQIKRFGVTTTSDWFDLHPFSRKGDRLIPRFVKPLWDKHIAAPILNDAKWMKRMADRFKYDDAEIKTYLSQNKDNELAMEMFDPDMFPATGGRRKIGDAFETLSNGFKKAARTPEFKFLKPLEDKMANLEAGDITGGKPFLVQYDIPFTTNIRFTSKAPGVVTEQVPGFVSENLLPQSVFNWKHGISTEPANINLENNFDFLNKTLTRKSIR